MRREVIRSILLLLVALSTTRIDLLLLLLLRGSFAPLCCLFPTVICAFIPASPARHFRKQPTSSLLLLSATGTTRTPNMSSPPDPSNNNSPPLLYRQTPLILSAPLSKLAQRDVYLKLDLLQSSGSFKDRGMARLCQELHPRVTTLISSSGGNAGLAVATVAAQSHDVQVQVIVPATTQPVVVDQLQRLGAQVTVHGTHWNQADQLARQRVDEMNQNNNNSDDDASPVAVYVSPYDNPLLWKGHSTLVDEIHDQLAASGSSPPSAIVVSVGGGGLLCGVYEGIAAHLPAWSSTTVVAAETEGANCFGAAFHAGRPVRLDAITSVATSLGALECTPVALERARQHPTLSLACTDAEAVHSCLQFARDHRMLVEPACGAALAVIYAERLRHQLITRMDDNDGPIVVEICGGSGVNLELLNQWKERFGVDV